MSISAFGFRTLLVVASLEVAVATAGPAINSEAAVRSAVVRAAKPASVLSLPGTVVASRQALIASEQAGVVADFLVRAGDRVSAGDPLVRLRRRPLELQLAAARGQLEEAEALRRSDELQLERLRQLSDSQVVSRQIADDALFEHQASTARVARLAAEVDRLVDALERTVVRAPFAGAVIAERTQLGQWLEPGDAVVELMALDDMEVRVEIPEERFAEVGVGTPVRIRVPGSAAPEIEGVLRAVVPKAADTARTFPAFVRIPPHGLGLEAGAGASVEARLAIGRIDEVVWVPQDAIVHRDGRSVVYRLEEDSRVKTVTVEPGVNEGLWQAVGGELDAGDVVVTEGHADLQDGQRVAAKRREYPWP